MWEGRMDEWMESWMEGREGGVSGPRAERTFCFSSHPVPWLYHSRMSLGIWWTTRSSGSVLCGSCRKQRAKLLAHPAQSSVANSPLWGLWFLRTTHLETSCWEVKFCMGKELCVRERDLSRISPPFICGFETLGFWEAPCLDGANLGHICI